MANTLYENFMDDLKKEGAMEGIGASDKTAVQLFTLLPYVAIGLVFTSQFRRLFWSETDIVPRYWRFDLVAPMLISCLSLLPGIYVAQNHNRPMLFILFGCVLFLTFFCFWFIGHRGFFRLRERINFGNRELDSVRWYWMVFVVGAISILISAIMGLLIVEESFSAWH